MHGSAPPRERSQSRVLVPGTAGASRGASSFRFFLPAFKGANISGILKDMLSKDLHSGHTVSSISHPMSILIGMATRLYWVDKPSSGLLALIEGLRLFRRNFEGQWPQQGLGYKTPICRPKQLLYERHVEVSLRDLTL